MSQNVLGIEPKQIVELGELVVDHDETLAMVTNQEVIDVRTDWATDEKFPDAQKGKKHYRASAVHFGQPITQDTLEGWCREHKKILATPKSGIDLASTSPHPKLDEVMPLALAGQFFVLAVDIWCAPYFFHRDDVERYLLSLVWFDQDKWRDARWWFLVLEELPLEA